MLFKEYTTMEVLYRKKKTNLELIACVDNHSKSNTFGKKSWKRCFQNQV